MQKSKRRNGFELQYVVNFYYKFIKRRFGFQGTFGECWLLAIVLAVEFKVSAVAIALWY
jgi:hypothetical protein